MIWREGAGRRCSFFVLLALAPVQVESSSAGAGVKLVETGRAGPERILVQGAERRPTIARQAWAVQLISEWTADRAEAEARSLQRQFPSILAGLPYRLQMVDMGNGRRYHRVMIPMPTMLSAVDLCRSLKEAGGDCLVNTLDVH